jgi:hypothetical protein
VILWMLYATCVTALLGLAAALLEPGLTGPRRFLWLGAMVAGLCIGLGAPFLASPGLVSEAVDLLPMSLSQAPAEQDIHRIDDSAGPSPLHRGAPSRRDRLANWGASTSRFDDVGRRVWMLSSAAVALVLVASSLRLRALRRGGRRRTLLGVEIVTNGSRGPAAAGVLSPWLLLPTWIHGLSALERGYLLAHELEHIRGRDPLLKLCGMMVLLMFPWNLAAWWCLRRLAFAIEVDCDARVIQRCGDAPQYARFLLDMAVTTRRVPALALSAVSLAGNLERRVVAMTNGSMTMPRRLVRGAAAALAALLVIVLDAPERPVHAQVPAGQVVPRPAQPPAVAAAPSLPQPMTAPERPLAAPAAVDAPPSPPAARTPPQAVQPMPSAPAATSAPSTGRGVVLGVVVDHDGVPVSSVRIGLVDAGTYQPPAGSFPITVTSAITSVNGRFMLVWIPDGEYVLQVSAEGYRSQQVGGVHVAEGRPANVRITLSRHGQPDVAPQHVVPAAPGARPAPPPPPPPPPPPAAAEAVLTGIVTDTAGLPIAGAQVSVPTVSGRAFTITNSEGRFRLGVSAGRRVVTVLAPNFEGVEVADVAFAVGGTTEVSVRLFPFR